MNDTTEIDYGPLKALVGSWQGAKGIDVAPEPDGVENNPYYETLTFSEIGDLTNAERQHLSMLFYRQIVRRTSNDEVFHDQTGYWIWDAEAKTVMHSFTIPRGVCVIAGGVYDGERDENGRVVLTLSAALDDPKWKIIESPFMQENASSKAFSQKIVVGNGTLAYTQTTLLDIYGREFEHTDGNELTAA